MWQKTHGINAQSFVCTAKSLVVVIDSDESTQIADSSVYEDGWHHISLTLIKMDTVVFHW